MGGFLFVFGAFYDSINGMKNNIESKIQEIMNQMQEMFQNAVGPRNRREYMERYEVAGLDWRFGLTPEQIIEQKIPANVIGCTGIAKLFCYLANRAHIKAFVVCTAKYDDWATVKNGENKTINGHQINAVEIDGKLMVFDAGRKHLHFIDTDLTSGSFIDARGSGNLDYMITAVVPGKDFLQMNTYQKLRNLYTSGDMNKNTFSIRPKHFLRAIKCIQSKFAPKSARFLNTQKEFRI